MLIVIAGILVSFLLFLYFERKRKDRIRQRRAHYQEKMQQLLQTLDKPHSDKDVQESDTTTAE
jgi:uncharacterized membrane protein YgaE (UPF0421/DUF939 family)